LKKAGPKKDAERRDKVSISTGKDTNQGNVCKNLPRCRRCYKQHRCHVTKDNLRVKRSDPWHWANASPKAVADPAQNGQDVNQKSHMCLGQVRKPASANASPSELRGLTQ